MVAYSAGLPGTSPVADHPDPLPFGEGLDDVGADRNPAHILDLAPGQGLAIGDQGQGLQQGAGVFGRPLRPELGDPGRELRPHLDTKAAADLGNLYAPALIVIGEFGQYLPQLFLVRLLALGKQGLQLIQVEGAVPQPARRLRLSFLS